MDSLNSATIHKRMKPINAVKHPTMNLSNQRESVTFFQSFTHSLNDSINENDLPTNNQTITERVSSTKDSLTCFFLLNQE
jgi:hypothetical protein